MLIITFLATYSATRLDAVDARGIVFEHSQRWTVFRNECSCLGDVRKQRGSNALGSNGFRQEGCQLGIGDT
jgi:hypothetical protein